VSNGVADSDGADFCQVREAEEVEEEEEISFLLVKVQRQSDGPSLLLSDIYPKHIKQIKKKIL